jgi:divalent metal cation (Fe/Co/Zn/Cd) transporter
VCAIDQASEKEEDNSALSRLGVNGSFGLNVALAIGKLVALVISGQSTALSFPSVESERW